MIGQIRRLRLLRITVRQHETRASLNGRPNFVLKGNIAKTRQTRGQQCSTAALCRGVLTEAAGHCHTTSCIGSREPLGSAA